jgi:pimeloyl-ACP methyl ester carboxylesterase
MESVTTDDGARLAWQSHGEGPPVLLIHGTGIAGQAWRPQIAALRDRFRVLSFDNRGVGASTMGSAPLTVERMAADALAVLDDAGVDRAGIVGHSLGGLIALALALQSPTRARSLALLCTFAAGRPVAAARPWIVWVGLRTRIGTRRMRRNAFLEMIMPHSILARGDRDALASEIGEVFGRDLADAPAVAMAQLKALSRCDLTPRLGELAAIPTLVVSGAEDRIAPPELGRALAKGIPNARYQELAVAAHALTIHRADELNALLLEHLTASC